MKKGLLILVVVLGGLLIVGGGCGIAGASVLKDVVYGKLEMNSSKYKLVKLCTRKLPVIGELEKFLDNKNYIVLLQNNNEIRASGGFMGSYIRIKTQGSGIKEIVVNDIYQPDGQIKGHVEPPYPIQEAFGQGWWRLRDANWDVDFASASGAIAWFMKEGGEGEVDGIVAINKDLIAKILGVLGGVKPETYDELVTDKNLDQLAQKYAETNFFPGTTAKRDFLGAVATQLQIRMSKFEIRNTISIGKLFINELNRGEILVWFKEDEWQRVIENKGWAGRINIKPDQDVLYISESNLGVNKANCCVKKKVLQEIRGESVSLTVEWQNDNPFKTPRPPIFWGGEYRNYVRVIIPANHNVKVVKIQYKELRLATSEDFASPNSLRQGISEDIYVIEKRGDVQIVGFWVKVGANSSALAVIEYKSIRVKEFKDLLVKRQPGEKEWEYKLVRDGKVLAEEVISRDLVISGYGE